MSEKDYIEKLFAENLDEINDNEPQDGHFERFQQKLKKQQQRKTISFRLVFQVAAAVVFVFLAVNQALIFFTPENQSDKLAETNNQKETTLASVSTEYEEVEFYYNNAINVGLNQWDGLVEKGLISEEEQSMMESELSEFETVYTNLQQDLESNPNDERVINAMLEHYQAKLNVINMIVNKLEEVKQKKNKNHEIEM